MAVSVRARDRRSQRKSYCLQKLCFHFLVSVEYMFGTPLILLTYTDGLVTAHFLKGSPGLYSLAFECFQVVDILSECSSKRPTLKLIDGDECTDFDSEILFSSNSSVLFFGH